MESNLVENLIKRNEKDLKLINSLMKYLDKLNSKQTVATIQNILINETMRIISQNKDLKLYLSEESKQEKRNG